MSRLLSLAPLTLPRVADQVSPVHWCGTALTATAGGLFFNFSGSGFISIFEPNNANWFMCASVGCTPHDDWFVNIFNVANGSGKLLGQSGIVEIAIGPGDPTGSTPLARRAPALRERPRRAGICWGGGGSGRPSVSSFEIEAQ